MTAGMLDMLTPLSGAILYAPGAFFFYPWKPVLLLLVGDTYDAGYRHFRRDHSNPVNLALHCVALGWQLLANFGLLAALDDMHELRSFRPLSLLSAVSWCFTLLFSPAPFACSLGSSASIVAAFLIAPLLKPRELEFCMMSCFIAVLLVASAYFRSPSIPASKTILNKETMKGLILFGIATAARLAAQYWHNALASHATYAYLAFAAVMMLVALLPKPVVPCVVCGLLLSRTIGELTGQDALLFFGGAFFAQLAQGVSHDVSRQQATLLSHQDKMADRKLRLQFEWSHCVFFPNLLLHSCLSSLRGRDAAPNKE